MKNRTKNYKKWMVLGSAAVLGFTSVPMGLLPVYAEESVVEDASGYSEVAKETIVLNKDWQNSSVVDGNIDVFPVILPNDGYLTIRYKGNTLTSADLQLLDNNKEACSDEISYSNSQISNSEKYYLNAGHYYICVAGSGINHAPSVYGYYSGTYSLKAEFKEVKKTDTAYHNSFETASELSLNKREVGFLTLGDMDDYYSFTAPETGKYDFALTADDNPHTNKAEKLTHAELYDSNQITMKDCENEDFRLTGWSSSASTQSAILEKGETYFLNIHGWNHEHAPGKYTILWKKADVLAEDITVTPAKKTVTAGQSVKLSATILPDTTTNQTVYWKSDNPTLATVKDGKVTTKRPGVVTITAETLDGSKKTACATITIRPKQTAAPKLKVGKRTLNASWKAQAGVTGYQVQYSQDKTFKKKGSKPAPTSKITLNNLKKGSYYVRVRAYAAIQTTKVYGAWSNVKRVKVK